MPLSNILILVPFQLPHCKMENWFIILAVISFPALFIKFIYNTKKLPPNLPPGPLTFPIFGNFLLPRKVAKLEPILLKLHAKFGRILTLHFGSTPSIFIADRSLAHQALIQSGTIFADRPPDPDGKYKNTISSAAYSPTWRHLRRNLTSQILNSSQVKSYSHIRNRVLRNLLECMKSQSSSGDTVSAMEYFQYSMFSLLVLMCFGDNIEEKRIKEIKGAHDRLMLSVGPVNTLNMWPRVTRIFFRKQRKELFVVRQQYKDSMIPLIREREKVKENNLKKDKHVLCYVETFLDLLIPEENRKLTEDEMVDLCFEFLNGGTDTTSAAWEWIMANLVKYPHIQEKLYMEIKEVMRDQQGILKVEDLQKMSYLKAVILEGLRRHPPSHFSLPHAVTEDVILGGFLVPKNASVNFSIAEIGWDPEAWEDPMAFKPERFLSSHMNNREEILLNAKEGSKEMKMMPFGAGRRICPGYALAMLHLEYFVGNMVWYFEWKGVGGNELDMEEKQEVLTVMKNPLKALLCPRVPLFVW